MALNLNKSGDDNKIETPKSTKKKLNLSKSDNNPGNKFNLTKDMLETKIDTLGSPQKKSKAVYFILGILIVVLAIIFFNRDDKSGIDSIESEIIATESNVEDDVVSEDVTPETDILEESEPEEQQRPVGGGRTPTNQTTFEQFKSGNSNVSALEDSKVQEIMNYLKTNNKITIIGYASSEGDPVFNKVLSEKRAMSMKDYLVSKGIDASRINTEGAGIDNPIGDNNTESGRKLNRRVDVMFN